MSQKFSAKVKNILSGDTVVLVPTKTAQFPIPERILTLQYVRGDSFEAKEYLRQLMIGKEIKFEVRFKVPTTGKEFGDILSPIFSSLIEHMLLKGLVKLNDNIRVETDDVADLVESLKAVEADAQKKQLGVWAPKFLEPEIVPLTEEIISISQSTPLTAIIERVISGDRVFARIIVNNKKHVELALLLAGLKAPRTDETGDMQKVAQQAKQFIEDKLLTSKVNVKVKIIGLNQTGVPLAIVEHPTGNNIHVKLLENGFAEVVDWQSSQIGSATMSQLRKAEQTAKALGKGVFQSLAGTRPVSGVSKTSISSKSLRPGLTIENVTVSKVINVDSFNVRLPSGEEITVQLASLRGPRPNDTTVTTNHSYQQALVQMAREYARSVAIGKSATMYIDGFREANKELGFDSRFVVSLNIGNKDLSESIVSNGFATVIKHNKQTAAERSMNWDRLVEIEEEQKKLGKKGVYFSGGDISKILTVSPRVVNASESYSKAKAFLNGFSKKGRIGGYYVEYVSSVNKVKLYNPKEGLRLTLILGGLSNEKSVNNTDGLDFMNKKYFQRGIEFDVYDQDKTGCFVGNLYANSHAIKTIQEEILENGLATTHFFGINSNKRSSELLAAEEASKVARKGVWKNFDASAAQKDVDDAAAQLKNTNLNVKPQFFDIEIVDIDDSGVLSYHITSEAVKTSFAKFKDEFNAFHLQNASASTTSVDLPVNLAAAPKKNELVSAKFSENDKYYRARVLNFDRTTRQYEVKHVDFGNIDSVPLSSLRILPKKFGLDVLKPFAHTCKLQNITLPPTQPRDYLSEALEVLEDLTYDNKVVLSGLPSSAPGIEFDAILYDETSMVDSTYTINKALVEKGYGIVEPTAPPRLKDYVDMCLAAQNKAKSERVGCWEFGDIRDDPEPF